MNLKLPRFWDRNGWSVWHAVAAPIMVMLGIALTWQVWVDILGIASNDEESSHIFLVPIIFIWLLWVRRERMRHCTPQGTFYGPVLIALGWMISTFGFHNAHQSLWHGGAVMVVVGCLVTIVGKEVPMRFLPAFALLVFLVPVPGTIRDLIAQPLQKWLAIITQQIMDIGGNVVERQGNKLIINGESVEIAEACNGLRMVFALVLVSYAFAFSTPLRTYVRFLIVLASPIAALGCNIIRMIPTVLLFGSNGTSGFSAFAFPVLRVMYRVLAPLGLKPYPTQPEANFFHDLAGWVMLLVAFLFLMSIIRVLRWAMIPVTRYTLAYD
jgi:exosortase